MRGLFSLQKEMKALYAHSQVQKKSLKRSNSEAQGKFTVGGRKYLEKRATEMGGS